LLRIDEQGNVKAVQVKKSISFLDQAAIDAVKQWKYEPMTIMGKAVPSVISITVIFKL
jgi:protein TonB